MKKAFLLNVAGIAAILFSAGSINAQIIDCNIFMQGTYLEVGINNNGAFGTSADAPTWYHANVYDTMYNPCTGSYSVPLGLGFVADPARDGWGTGSPAYYGDFIMPGTPHEGWGISDLSGTGYAYASYYDVSGASGYSGPLTGANTTYTIIGTTKQAVWTGQLTTDTLLITQTTTIDTTNLFFLVHIDFVNGGSSTIDSFYYMRTVNAHNDEVASSNPNTMNKIEHQLPNTSNLSVVSAKGTVYTDMYMELGTNDLRAKAFIIKYTPLPTGTFASIYYEDTANYMYADSLLANTGMGLVFRIPTMGPGGSTSIDYGYAFKGGLLDSVLQDTSISLATKPVKNKTQHVSVYPNPTSDIVNVAGLNTGDRVTLYDIMGRTIGEKQIAQGQTAQAITTGQLATGIYILVVKDAAGNELTRVPVSKL